MKQSGWLQIPPGSWSIKAYKYPDIPHMKQLVQPVRDLCGHRMFLENPGATCEHYSRNAIYCFPNRAFWVIQPDRRHIAVAVFKQDGRFRSFYIHIAMPPELHGDHFSYVDMDLDVLVDPKGAIEVVDRDEFIENRQRYGYPQDLVGKTERALDAVIEDIHHKRFPFDGSVEEYYHNWLTQYLGGL